MLNRTQIETIKQEWLKGDRIAIKEMVDEDLPSGLEGTVTLVDDIGQIQVNWDNGSTLAIDPEIDSFVHLNQNMKLIMPLNISYLLKDPDETDDEYETTDTIDIKLLQKRINSENQDLPENGLVEYMDEGSLKDKLLCNDQSQVVFQRYLERASNSIFRALATLLFAHQDESLRRSMVSALSPTV